MAGDYLLDTSIAIAYLAGEQDVVDRILATEVIYVPAIVLGELFFGANKSTRVTENLSKIQQMLTWSLVPAFDAQTAFHYGQIKFDLRAKGSPIPDNDLWIAAISKQHGLTLVTRDKHFTEVADLRTVHW